MTADQLQESYKTYSPSKLYEHLRQMEKGLDGIAQKVSSTHPDLGTEIRKLRSEFEFFSLKLGAYHLWVVYKLTENICRSLKGEAEKTEEKVEKGDLIRIIENYLKKLKESPSP